MKVYFATNNDSSVEDIADALDTSKGNIQVCVGSYKGAFETSYQVDICDASYTDIVDLAKENGQESLLCVSHDGSVVMHYLNRPDVDLSISAGRVVTIQDTLQPIEEDHTYIINERRAFKIKWSRDIGY